MPSRSTPEVFVPEDDIKYLQNVAKKFGAIVHRHFGGVITWSKNRFAKALFNGGGLYGVPKFRKRAGVTGKLHGSRWGGRISKKSLVKAWKKGGKQIIGFPDRNPAAATFGAALQVTENRSWTLRERINFRRRSVTELLHPRYERPARPIVSPFAAAQGPEMLHEVRKRTEKTLASKAANAKVRAAAIRAQARAMNRAARSASRIASNLRRAL